MKEEDLDMALLWIEKNKERIEDLLAEILEDVEKLRKKYWRE